MPTEVLRCWLLFICGLEFNRNYRRKILQPPTIIIIWLLQQNLPGTTWPPWHDFGRGNKYVLVVSTDHYLIHFRPKASLLASEKYFIFWQITYLDFTLEDRSVWFKYLLLSHWRMQPTQSMEKSTACQTVRFLQISKGAKPLICILLNKSVIFEIKYSSAAGDSSALL